MRLLAACLTLSILVGPLEARPAHLRDISNHFGAALPARLHACSLCHISDKPTESEEETHNAFGQRLVELKSDLRRASKKAGIIERVEAAALEDADGDGAPNLVEILTGHRPGDAADVPTATEIATGSQKAAAWRAALLTYPWEPFEPVRRPAVPPINQPEWVRNPLDTFLAEMYQKRGVTPRSPAATRTLYGLDQPDTKPFGELCLAARRLAERGVRFIQVFHGSNGGAGAWDAHGNLQAGHSRLCKQTDQPLAALLKDLKRTGLLEDTIVVWSTEFGRTPGAQGGNGRDHHPFGFSVWLAGGGIKGGIAHGKTDELGFHAVENRHYITDIHATVLHQLGLDPRKLEVPGRKRLDIDYGKPIMEIVA